MPASTSTSASSPAKTLIEVMRAEQQRCAQWLGFWQRSVQQPALKSTTDWHERANDVMTQAGEMLDRMHQERMADGRAFHHPIEQTMLSFLGFPQEKITAWQRTCDRAHDQAYATFKQSTLEARETAQRLTRTARDAFPST